MLAFCAYYQGTVKGSEAEFDTYVKDIHMPLVAKYPHLQQLRFLKGVGRDGNPPMYYLSFELFFNNWEEFEIAKASDERDVAVQDAAYLASLFEGQITHTVYEVNDIPV